MAKMKIFLWCLILCSIASHKHVEALEEKTLQEDESTLLTNAGTIQDADETKIDALDDEDALLGQEMSPKSNLQALDCNFESNFCGWSNSRLDNFDWTRNRGSTSSFRTGPSSDHTLKNASGWYIYIETSSPRRFGEKARLVSSISLPRGTVCLKFWHHMFGATINTLNVLTERNGSISNVWTKSGNQGNRWIAGNVTISRSQSYKIIFEGIAGTSFTGDIALDDITVTHGACQPAPPPPSQALNCDFENGLCGWNNSALDNFDWTRNRGRTPSSSTGPSSDHTFRNASGWYIYIETSSPRRNGDKALLVSSVFLPRGSICLNFWYHMFGSNIRTLNVLTKRGNSSTIVWTRSRNQGNVWIEAAVTITRSNEYKIVFEGIRGSSFEGDIALDDIRVRRGACPVTPPTTTPPPRTTTATPTTPQNQNECRNYRTLSSIIRSMSQARGNILKCDQRDLRKGWYRFIGDAGSAMPTSCVPKNRCGAHAPGWMQGSHPTPQEGIVTRKVCYHWFRSCCHWSNFIRVRNCGGFFVYELIKTPVCWLRYCGNGTKGVSNPTTTPPPKTTTPPSTRRFPTTQGPRRLRCFECRHAGCRLKIVSCNFRDAVCFYGHVRIQGRSFNPAGCAPRKLCQFLCDRVRKSPGVTACSVQCCRGDLCNRRRFPTPTRRPTFPTRRRGNHYLRALLKLLEAFKKIIEALEYLLRGHLNNFSKRDASFHKREIVSMMSNIDDHVARMKDSRDPEVLQALEDVHKTRMRAKDVLKKLNDVIGENSNIEI